MQRVFVLDKNMQQLAPCHPARAKELLTKGKAAVFRRHPFTIILKDRDGGEVHPVTFKVDPGSKVTGISLVLEGKNGSKVIWGAELHHRGNQIKSDLDSRRANRRSRRNRKTRYRAPRFDNRTRSSGWLPPSLMHRVFTTTTWFNRLRKFAPITGTAVELVKFDIQKMENPEISGIEYQQGTLAGYEVREYLLEKWGRKCAYCGKEDVPLQIEHIQARTNGGTNRISNLSLACEECNTAKGTKDIREFLQHKPEVLKRILAQAKRPLKDATAVNATRWRLLEEIKKSGLPVECGSGGRTKFNRTQQRYRKEHWIDAACVGVSGEKVFIPKYLTPLIITAHGHGSRQMCRVDKYGFPRTAAKAKRIVFGFKTGDMVKAIVPKGKNKGIHIGRVAVRAVGNFNIGKVKDISYRYCTVIHRADGYSYK